RDLTAPISARANGLEVQQVLEGLRTITNNADSNIHVDGGPGGPYTVYFVDPNLTPSEMANSRFIGSVVPRLGSNRPQSEVDIQTVQPGESVLGFYAREDRFVDGIDPTGATPGSLVPGTTAIQAGTTVDVMVQGMTQASVTRQLRPHFSEPALR